ncbi:MAG: hypothetical protein MJ078_07835, partial [Clostridia bacterium]|nr:hypothetical protein [Clostridia bacterium]
RKDFLESHYVILEQNRQCHPQDRLWGQAPRNPLLFVEILGGIVVAILVLGWLLSKVTGGKATAKRSFAERVAKHKSDEKPARKTVYKVGGVEFNDYGAALQFAAQVFPNQNHPSSYITKEER